MEARLHRQPPSRPRLLDRKREPVTSSRHVLNAALAAAAGVKGTANCRDLDGKVAFLDRNTRPHGIHDLILGDEFAGTFEEKQQKVGGAQTERDRGRRAVRASSQQFAGRHLEPEILEGQNPRCQKHCIQLPVQGVRTCHFCARQTTPIAGIYQELGTFRKSFVSI
jgi:hypothetical protein